MTTHSLPYRRSHRRSICLWLTMLLVLNAWPLGNPDLSAGADCRRPDDRLFEAAIPKEGNGVPGYREELAKGKFLVASRRLDDPNFSETVVLLIEYGPDGAMGLVVNRPSNVKLSTVFPDVEALKERKDTVYVGGPVAVNQMLMLIRSSKAPAASKPVIDNVYMSASWKVLEGLIKEAAADQQFRLYAGYAGWAPNQLDFERTRGDWHVIKADADSVFALDPKALWQELIRRATIKWVRLEKPPFRRIEGDKRDES
ncbi:MAG: YqgE/AlgH family protein [Deltaproteobacteria bacterium]|nr:YqgE/AlgH family protein [Deltaproteobacteria bacterium]